MTEYWSPWKRRHQGQLQAYVYVIAAPYLRLLTDLPWDLEDFWRQHREQYLDGCREFSAWFRSHRLAE